MPTDITISTDKPTFLTTGLVTASSGTFDTSVPTATIPSTTGQTFLIPTNLGDKPSLLRLVLALAGVVVVLDPSLGGLPVPREAADWLALGAGLCFALTNILLRKLDQVPPNARVVAMFVGGMVMAGATGLAGAVQGQLPAPALPLPSPFSLSRTSLFLLHPARRLWKARLESCRLQSLEGALLGLARHDGHELGDRGRLLVGINDPQPAADIEPVDRVAVLAELRDQLAASYEASAAAACAAAAR